MEDIIKDKSVDYDEDELKDLDEEIENIEKKEEFEKYIENGVMHQLPPKDVLKNYFYYVLEELDEGIAELQYGKYKVQITLPYSNADGYVLAINGRELAISGDLDDVYNWLENIDKTYEMLLSDYEKREQQIDDLYDEILKKINNLNSESELRDLAVIESSIELYSDIYKDEYNFRPRGTIGEFYSLIKKRAPKLKEEFDELSYDEAFKLMYGED